MTTFGKVLVFLNLVLSIGAAAWAMGLYTQRVNWTGKASADGTPGKIKDLADKINQRYAVLGVAQARFVRPPPSSSARKTCDPLVKTPIVNSLLISTTAISLFWR